MARKKTSLASVLEVGVVSHLLQPYSHWLGSRISLCQSTDEWQIKCLLHDGMLLTHKAGGIL